MGTQELLILLLLLAILAVVLRGMYVVLSRKRGQLKIQLEKNIPEYNLEELELRELPNGGARHVERSFAEVMKRNSMYESAPARGSILDRRSSAAKGLKTDLTRGRYQNSAGAATAHNDEASVQNIEAAGRHDDAAERPQVTTQPEAPVIISPQDIDITAEIDVFEQYDSDVDFEPEEEFVPGEKHGAHGWTSDDDEPEFDELEPDDQPEPEVAFESEVDFEPEAEPQLEAEIALRRGDLSTQQPYPDETLDVLTAELTEELRAQRTDDSDAAWELGQAEYESEDEPMTFSAVEMETDADTLVEPQSGL